MKILHYSDKSDPEFLQKYQECDVLICTGDLTQFDFVGLQQVTTKKPSFGVYGNHDSGAYLEYLEIINLHNKVYEWNGLKWGGFQGCPRYKQRGGPQFTEAEALQWEQTFPQVDMLLLHAGPKDMLDDPSDEVHIGSEAVRKYVLEKNPKYIFCGHQYSNAELKTDKTTIFRTYGSRYISI